MLYSDVMYSNHFLPSQKLVQMNTLLCIITFDMTKFYTIHLDITCLEGHLISVCLWLQHSLQHQDIVFDGMWLAPACFQDD